MSRRGLEIRLLNPTLEGPLEEFFKEVIAAGDDSLFHPHPFTGQEAARIAAYKGDDLYYVMVERSNVLGYGMLRGWDAGYDVPSLGIYIRKSARMQGLGEMFMHFLHSAARRKGAAQIRLKVYPENEAAKSMYESLGYQFGGKEEGQLVGIYEVRRSAQ